MSRPQTLNIISTSAKDTQQFGAHVATQLKKGDIVLLMANLGSGKTTLVQGLAKKLGVRHNALSPTFILAQTLAGRIPIHHLDFYRMSKKEIWDMGIDDYLLGQGTIKKGIVLIEWAERCKEVWPKDRLEIKMTIKAKSTDRLISIRGQGKRYSTIIKGLHRVYGKN